jgi:signal-transduction protein with cAMP-binding, CBS, and nucleotidyltransferase domain
VASEPLVRTKILVREVMNSPVVTSGPNEPVQELARKMDRLKVGSVVITEGETAIGIVTDGDIVKKVVAIDGKPSKLKAKDVMSTPLQTIDAASDITEAARSLRRLRMKRLGVTYKGKLVGVVSMSDLTAVTPELIYLVSEKARIMTGESLRRGRVLAGYCDSCGEWSDSLMEFDGRFLCEDCRAEGGKEEVSD